MDIKVKSVDYGHGHGRKISHPRQPRLSRSNENRLLAFHVKGWLGGVMVRIRTCDQAIPDRAIIKLPRSTEPFIPLG